MEAIYSCSWGYGLHWLKETWRLFKRAPVVWLISGLLCGFIMLIPTFFSAPANALIKGIISFFVAPLLFAGVLSMAYRCDQGSQIKVNQLFSGFSFIGSFIALQLINVALVLLGYGISIVMATGIGALLLPIIIVLGALFFLQLSWFAPVLIVLGGQSAWAAMKISLAGCAKSWKAWIVALLGMGLVWIGAFFVFALSGMLINTLGLSMLVRLDADVLFTPIISIVMVMHTLLVYIAYRDVFGGR